MATLDRRLGDRALRARRPDHALGRRADWRLVPRRPGQFDAPGLSLPLALEVGRREFGALNLTELALAVLSLALAADARPERAIWPGSGWPPSSWCCNGCGCCRRSMPAPR